MTCKAFSVPIINTLQHQIRPGHRYGIYAFSFSHYRDVVKIFHNHLHYKLASAKNGKGALPLKKKKCGADGKSRHQMKMSLKFNAFCSTSNLPFFTSFTLLQHFSPRQNIHLYISQQRTRGLLHVPNTTHLSSQYIIFLGNKPFSLHFPPTNTLEDYMYIYTYSTSTTPTNNVLACVVLLHQFKRRL